MNRPLVSVIIPVYNAGVYLRECLDSIVCQTLKDIEIICVDDGSTDDSLKILEEYKNKDDRVKVVCQQNKFAGVARNTGMEVASGKYYVFLDADDFFEPNMLEKMYLQSEKTDADVCCCAADKYDNVTKEFIKAGHFLQTQYCKGKEIVSKNILKDNIFRMTASVPWNKMFLAEFVKKHGLTYQELRSGNDVRFVYCAMCLAEKITYVNDVLVHYRVGITTNIQSNKAKNATDFLKALSSLKEALEHVGVFSCVEAGFIILAMEHCEWNLATLKGKSFEAYKTLAREIKEQYIYKFDIATKEIDFFTNKQKYISFMSMMGDVVVPRFSIAVAVYNVEDYLDECLTSIVNQTFRDIEIICVNDGSTDSSDKILEKYRQKDERIKVIHKDKNEGLLLARKSAVEVATGEYLIFVDSDDYLELELCECLNKELQNNTYDILQFGVNVKDYSNNEKKAAWLKKALSPLTEELTSLKILEHAFITRKYSTVLWGKVYKTALCKKVFSILPDVHCFIGEDIFSYFYLAYYAKSYKGLEGHDFYVYRYGLGVGNSELMPLSKYELYCKMARWAEHVKDTVIRHDNNAVVYDSYLKMSCRMLEDCCRIYLFRIKPEDKSEALKILLKYWMTNPMTEEKVRKLLDISATEIMNESIPVYTKYSSYFSDTQKPRVSVVIPVYNCQKYLKECLESIRNQTLKDIEIICVNDGSFDDSLELVEYYAEKDLRITVISKKNGGASSARNIGTAVARGKYVYYLDSDDYLVQNALERLFDCAEANETDILYFGAQSFFEDEIQKREHAGYDKYYDRTIFWKEPVSGEKMFTKLLEEKLFRCSVPLQFIKKEFLMNTGISFKEGIIHEDELFSAILAVKAERVLVIEDKLYMRRVRGNSVMTSTLDCKKFIALFIVSNTLAATIVTDTTLSGESKKALRIHAKNIHDSSIREFRKLPQSEKNNILEMLPVEYGFFYREMYAALVGEEGKNNKIKKLENKIKKLEKKLRDVKKSKSYRIGRMITYIPRKICREIKCCKEYGIKYTLKRGFNKSLKIFKRE